MARMPTIATRRNGKRQPSSALSHTAKHASFAAHIHGTRRGTRAGCLPLALLQGRTWAWWWPYHRTAAAPRRRALRWLLRAQSPSLPSLRCEPATKEHIRRAEISVTWRCHTSHAQEKTGRFPFKSPPFHPSFLPCTHGHEPRRKCSQKHGIRRIPSPRARRSSSQRFFCCCCTGAPPWCAAA